MTFAHPPCMHSSSSQGAKVLAASGPKWGDAALRPQQPKPPTPPACPGQVPASLKSCLAQPSRSGAEGKWPRKDEASSPAAWIATKEIITSLCPCSLLAGFFPDHCCKRKVIVEMSAQPAEMISCKEPAGPCAGGGINFPLPK